jgi:hypothetical protein
MLLSICHHRATAPHSHSSSSCARYQPQVRPPLIVRSRVPVKRSLTFIRQRSHQLAHAIADAARASMSLPGGPLAVLGLPTFPTHPSTKTAAAAVIGIAITRANDIFNMRMYTEPAVPHGPTASLPPPQWPAHYSDAQAFCASLRLQRVWRGHCGRICALINRNRVLAAAPAIPLDAINTLDESAAVSQGSSCSVQNHDENTQQHHPVASHDDDKGNTTQLSGFNPGSSTHAFDGHASTDPATCRLNAHVDRMMLDEVSAANSRVPLSPDVAAAGVHLAFVLRLRLWLPL